MWALVSAVLWFAGLVVWFAVRPYSEGLLVDGTVVASFRASNSSLYASIVSFAIESGAEIEIESSPSANTLRPQASGKTVRISYRADSPLDGRVIRPHGRIISLFLFAWSLLSVWSYYSQDRFYLAALTIVAVVLIQLLLAGKAKSLAEQQGTL